MQKVIFRYGNEYAKIDSRLADVLEKLICSDALIIVEGKRDKEALLEIGIDKDRIILIAQKTILEILDKLRKKRVREIIDMIDTDYAGRKMSADLYKNAGNIKINQKLKRIILTKIRSKRVEDLLNFLERN